MRIDKDYFQKPNVPKYVLCKSNKEHIGTIRCTSKTHDEKYRDLDEISFTTYMNIDGKKNPYYDAIDIMKYVLLPDIGFFSISSVNVQSEGTEFEYKEVIAKSYECLMGQKFLESFVINHGLTESIDSVQFYNIGDKEHSLLHLILSLCPEWQVGHIDVALCTKQRSFKVDRQDVYSFLMNDVATAFECVFLFDTLTNTINIYEEKNVGNDTNVHVSYNNLLKNTNIKCDIDNVKTCLSVAGSDDLTLREVNMGFNKIYCLTPYLSTDYMSKSLYHACNKWLGIRSNYESQYNTLLSQYQNYIKQINELTYTKMPSDLDSTDWSLYGLNPLKEKLSVYEQKQAVSMKAGHGDTSSSYYQSEYLPIYNTINAINTQINIVNSQLITLTSSRDNIGNQMSAIMDIVSMKNNFTTEQLSELNSFIREDELNSDNFVVTDTMTDDEKFEMLNEMLSYANEELYKVATPQLTFSVNMANIFSIPEFSDLYGQFKTGNYIWVALRDDYHVKPRLLTIHTDFYNPKNFSVSFGNIVRKSKDEWDDIGEFVNIGKSASTSVSFNASYWNESAKETSDIGKMLNEGLLSAGKYLSSGDDNEFQLDKRGIFVNTISGDYAYKDSIFIGGGRILFTDDGWKSVAMAVGRAIINGESRFGTFADFCIASYIAGSTIVGGTITGTRFNNGNGTFLVDENGNLTATSATIKGTVQANDGYFGGENGFKIASGKAYTNNKSSWNSSTTGVYLGTDGISLGKNSPFRVDKNGNMIAESAEIKGKVTSSEIIGSSISNGNGTFNVTPQGVLTAKSGTIGGINFNANSIYSSNSNFSVDSNGNVIAKTITLTAQKGSTLGGISFDADGTYGDFSNGFCANKSFGLEGKAKEQFDSLVVGTIEAEKILAGYAEIGYVDGLVGDFETIYGKDVTITNTLQAHDTKFTNLSTQVASIEDKLIYNKLPATWNSLSVVTNITKTNYSLMGADGTQVGVTGITGVDYTTIYFLGIVGGDDDSFN